MGTCSRWTTTWPPAGGRASSTTPVRSAMLSSRPQSPPVDRPADAADGAAPAVAAVPRSANTRWYVIAGAAVVAAVLAGAMIGPAGPTWWRVPLTLLDHLPGVHIE